MPSVSEQEVKRLLAPLALSIMQSTPEISSMMNLASDTHDKMKLLEQYENILNELYQCHIALG